MPFRRNVFDFILEQVLWARKSYCIPQILHDIITCSCSRFMLLAHKSFHTYAIVRVSLIRQASHMKTLPLWKKIRQISLLAICRYFLWVPALNSQSRRHLQYGRVQTGTIRCPFDRNQSLWLTITHKHTSDGYSWSHPLIRTNRCRYNWNQYLHDDVTTWKHSAYFWPFVRWINRRHWWIPITKCQKCGTGQDITTRQTNKTYEICQKHYQFLLDYKAAFLQINGWHQIGFVLKHRYVVILRLVMDFGAYIIRGLFRHKTCLSN